MFEVGDKVRVISDEYGPDQLGMTGVVDEINRPGELDVQIEYDSPLYPGLKKNQYRSKHLELISMVGPIRTETVTTHRIEPGVYGRLSIDHDAPGYVSIGLTDPKGTGVEEGHRRSFNSAQLRDLARVATELAEFLDAQ